MEEGLRCTGLAGVVGEVTKRSLTASRRLQLAACENAALRRCAHPIIEPVTLGAAVTA
jgi:hypothetical protein